jgi:hypothetical protein
VSKALHTTMDPSYHAMERGTSQQLARKSRSGPAKSRYSCPYPCCKPNLMSVSCGVFNDSCKERIYILRRSATKTIWASFCGKNRALLTSLRRTKVVKWRMLATYYYLAALLSSWRDGRRRVCQRAALANQGPPQPTPALQRTSGAS